MRGSQDVKLGKLEVKEDARSKAIYYMDTIDAGYIRQGHRKG